MKQGHAVCSASNSGACKSASAGPAKAAGEIADAEPVLGTQAHLRAEQHRFVVGWELRDWLAAEQDWFPKGSGI